MTGFELFRVQSVEALLSSRARSRLLAVIDRRKEKPEGVRGACQSGDVCFGISEIHARCRRAEIKVEVLIEEARGGRSSSDGGSEDLVAPGQRSLRADSRNDVEILVIGRGAE